MSNLAILAIDAATEACSVALMYQGKLFHQFEVCPQQHSVKILPMVDKVLTDAGVSLAQLDGLAFGCGPGSFTGVRIGVGVAQGLAFGADLPMIPVSSLQAMAQGVLRLELQQNSANHASINSIHVAIDARMSEVYTAQFVVEDGIAKEQQAPQVLNPENVDVSDNCFAAGTGWQTYVEQLSSKASGISISEVLYPDAQDMLAIAAVELVTGNSLSAADATPLYVRDTVTWKKLPGRE